VRFVHGKFELDEDELLEEDEILDQLQAFYIEEATWDATDEEARVAAVLFRELVTMFFEQWEEEVGITQPSSSNSDDEF